MKSLKHWHRGFLFMVILGDKNPAGVRVVVHIIVNCGMAKPAPN